MNEEQREKIALFRFSVIGSLISGELAYGDVQRQLQELGGRNYSIPFSDRTRISSATIEEWLYAYRRHGFEALKPKPRRATRGAFVHYAPSWPMHSWPRKMPIPSGVSRQPSRI